MDRKGRERLPAGGMMSKGEGGESFKTGTKLVKCQRGADWMVGVRLGRWQSVGVGARIFQRDGKLN